MATRSKSAASASGEAESATSPAGSANGQTATGATGAAGGEPYNVTRTAPAEIKRHDISDEELTMLQSEERRSFEKDVLWAAIGATVASFAPMISGLKALNATPSTFGIFDVVECVIFGAGLTVTIIMAAILNKRPAQSSAAKLAQEIRERSARKVGGTD